ncbi:glutathione peroxidase [Selenomonas bovis]|uniref:glutathione peroxidase n=1 Tax=Selenomonas bovis TaxID=416586 RepID=UPI0023F63663|nr:glutathione peroxidase [Selenomonas bovis]
MQKLYLKYKDKGLEILGFPCNQFAGQEPGSNAQVQEFCRLNYGVTFQIFAKGDVRGENAQPLFQYLTEQQGFQGFDPAHPYTEMLTKALKENFPSYLEGDSIKWNFTKFLVDREGNVVARFEPTTAMSEVEAGVAACLKTAP